MKNKTTSLTAYTFAHFCVDFSCMFLLFGVFAPGAGEIKPAIGFLLYSVIAFGLQAPFGWLLEKRPRFAAGILGCALVACSFVAFSLPWLALVLCALGNALFHVEGGIDSLVHASGKISRSGVFVSSGALGVGLGTLAGKGMSDLFALPLLLLGVSALLILLFRLPVASLKTQFQTDGKTIVKKWTPVFVLLFIAIMIRSLGGFIIPMPWKAEYILLPAIGACLGKVCGGFAADRLGAKNTGAYSLLISIPLLCFGWWSPWLCFAGILLFNMNMPITLCAVSDRLPGHPGLAFGVTTLALLLGSILPAFYRIPQQPALILLPILCAASAVCILLTVSNKGGKKHESI